MTRTMAAAMDFGTSKIVTLVGDGGGGKPVEILGVGNAPYAGFIRGRWNEPEALIEAIRRSIVEAENQSHRKIHQVHVGLPGEVIRVVLNEVSLEMRSSGRRVRAVDVDKLMDAANECEIPSGGEIIHRSPAWFAVDQERTMEPIGRRGGSLKCMASFIVADMGFIGEIGDRLQELNIETRGYLSASLGEALMLVPPEERDDIAILLDIGYLSSELMAVQGDALIYHEVLSLGGGHITADLAYELELTMALAEQLKRKFAFGSTFAADSVDIGDEDGKTLRFMRQQVAGIIEPRIDELCDMVRDLITESDLHIPAKTNIYLTGGGIGMMRGGKEYIAAMLNMPVKTPLPKAPKLNSPTFTSSLGLMDLCFETIQNELETAQGAVGRALDAVKGLFARS